MSTDTVRDKVDSLQTPATPATVVFVESPDTTRRVKVYSFGQSMQWEDMGTGYVSMDFIERNQSLTIVVRSEEDGECAWKL